MPVAHKRSHELQLTGIATLEDDKLVMLSQ